ncbi:60S ribosomal protein L37 [Sporothrix epigloea]|uniref:60S ribosomal protein L37 n=1 Tax=Sporothrix epigloea TaxID=1892477 RepID=A0ABP0DPK4_9PEZI
MPSDTRPPSTSGPEALVPDGLQTAFNTAKDAKLLTVHGMDGVGCGWLVIRFLGFWLRQCTFDPQTGNSDIGIVVCAFKHNMDYYLNHLQPFGIDLAWHVEKGHVTFLGNQFRALITDYDASPPAPPTATFDASLDLLMEQSFEMRAKYDRAVLLLDNPEMGMMLTTDDDDVRVEKWLIAVDNATYNYDNAIVGMMIDRNQSPHMTATGRTADATASAICSLNLNSQMSVTVRPNNGMIGSGKDGRVSIVYRMDHHVDVGDEVDDGYEEDHNIKVALGGRIEIMGDSY